MKRQQEYFRQQQEVARCQEDVYRKQQGVLRSQEDVLRQQEMAIFRQLVDGRVLDHGPSSLQRALYNAQSRGAEYKNRSALVHLLPTEIVSEIFLTGQHLQLYDAKWKSEKVCFEILVSHVSREWRAIALGTVILWKSASSFSTSLRGYTRT